ncbi:alkaline phosphatase D family protein [Amycolatopsis antarctica]|uniref:alkaline phosphatase D family protein n=1 Tax=Amycolatopsis antarctica TaxID=1854586 RepID=UPI001F0B440F|nr:alkaline phosphatase D family protein [Amycolatopsis antarctica]
MPADSGKSVSRRSVLLGGASATAAAVALGAEFAGPRVARAAATRGAGGPGPKGPLFNLGVASGDPLPDSVVLWTRLAADPLAADGLGGMPDRRIPVDWEIATDERFTRIVRRGTVDAVRESAHSVHVEPAGLRPGTEYFYRFRARGAVSGTGRTRTSPAPGTLGELTMCFASCSHYGEGHFTAYRHLAADEPGLVLHLGDYQYEYAAKAGEVRTVFGPETTTLAGYRQRHAQYKTDLDLQAAHAVAPWLVVWDDHETENNWAGDVPEESSQTPGAKFPPRRAAAFQAYYENMPLRSTAKPSGPDMRLYRRIGWGGLVGFHMLDTRQYRDDQACGDGNQSGCAQRLDPERTITGAEQEKWLLDGLARSTARWDVLGQQVFFARRDNTVGEGSSYSMDAWDGYVASQDRIAAALGGPRVRNGVVLTGDVHRHWAAEIPRDYADLSAGNVATELVTTSITSGGDGDDDPNRAALDENPHIKYHKNRRGYVRTKFTRNELRADFRTVARVSKPDAGVGTDTGFVVRDGDPVLRRA